MKSNKKIQPLGDTRGYFSPWSFLICLPNPRRDKTPFLVDSDNQLKDIDDSFVLTILHEYSHFLSFFATPYYMQSQVLPFLNKALVQLFGFRDGSHPEHRDVRIDTGAELDRFELSTVKEIDREAEEFLLWDEEQGELIRKAISPTVLMEHLAAAIEETWRKTEKGVSGNSGDILRSNALYHGLDPLFPNAEALMGRILDALDTDAPVKTLLGDGKTMTSPLELSTLNGLVYDAAEKYQDLGIPELTAFLRYLHRKLPQKPLRLLVQKLSGWTSGERPVNYIEELLSLFQPPALAFGGEIRQSLCIYPPGEEERFEPFGVEDAVVFITRLLRSGDKAGIKFHAEKIKRSYCHLTECPRKGTYCDDTSCPTFKVIHRILGTIKTAN